MVLDFLEKTSANSLRMSVENELGAVLPIATTPSRARSYSGEYRVQGGALPCFSGFRRHMAIYEKSGQAQVGV